MNAPVRIEQTVRIEMTPQDWGLDLSHREVASIAEALNRKAERLINTPGLARDAIAHEIYCYQARWAEAGATSEKALRAAKAILHSALCKGDMNRPETQSPAPSAEHPPAKPYSEDLEMDSQNTTVEIYPLDAVVEKSHSVGLADEVLAHLADVHGMDPGEVTIAFMVEYRDGDTEDEED